MSRIQLDRGTTDWITRIHEISEELGLGSESEIAEHTSMSDTREARRQLSDRLFVEFGISDRWAVEAVEHIVPVAGGEIRVRQYRPVGSTALLPGYLLLHGGGFTLGTIDELVNRAISSERAAEAKVTLFDVDYRLAPEYPFPTALEDAYSALVWIHANRNALSVDADRLVVGGVSAGGNIAAALGHLARDRGGPRIAGQILEVPAVDLRSSTEWPREYAEANNIGGVTDLLNLYTAGESADDPYVSPAAGSFVGLPLTHIMTAEYDPLGAAAEAYVTDLRAAGVDVSATRHLGFLHGTPGITGRVRGARLWHAEVVAVLRQMTAG